MGTFFFTAYCVRGHSRAWHFQIIYANTLISLEEAALNVTEHEVRTIPKWVNLRKAAGPDEITGSKTCGEQLAHLFTVIINLSFSQK